MEANHTKYTELGCKMRELLADARSLIENIHKYKCVKRGERYYPSLEIKPICDKLYKLNFNNFYNDNSTGHEFWRALDAACSADCMGAYELVKYSSRDVPQITELLDPVADVTRHDYGTILEFCESLDVWIDDATDAITMGIVDNDIKYNGLQHAKDYKLQIEELMNLARPVIRT